MSEFESYLLAAASPLNRGERRFRTACIAAAVIFASYLLLTTLRGSAALSDLVFQSLMLPVPVAVWAAYLRSPEAFRRPMFVFAWASTFWLIGSVVWYGYWVANGHQTPPPPGIWDLFFVAARILLIAGTLMLMRSLVAVRLAALDTCVIASAGIALGAAFIGRSLDVRVSSASLVTLNRPLLGIVTLMLIASAALGTFERLPRFIAFFAAGEVCLTIGSLIYSYKAVQGEFIDNRWANLWWGAGAELTILAALVIALHVDRPVHVGPRQRVPASPGAQAVLSVGVLALAITLGVACWAELADDRTVALVGLLASVAVGVAMTLRARDSMQSVASAYLRLDQSLRETESARDELAAANSELARANAEIRQMHVAVAQMLNNVDDKTHGRMRAVMERAGRDLTAILEEHLEND